MHDRDQDMNIILRIRKLTADGTPRVADLIYRSRRVSKHILFGKVHSTKVRASCYSLVVVTFSEDYYCTLKICFKCLCTTFSLHKRNPTTIVNPFTESRYLVQNNKSIKPEFCAASSKHPITPFMHIIRSPWHCEQDLFLVNKQEVAWLYATNLPSRQMFAQKKLARVINFAVDWMMRLLNNPRKFLHRHCLTEYLQLFLSKSARNLTALWELITGSLPNDAEAHGGSRIGVMRWKQFGRLEKTIPTAVKDGHEWKIHEQSYREWCKKWRCHWGVRDILEKIGLSARFV